MARDEHPDDRLVPIAPLYEPPRVERVLSQVELEREILYAGTQGGSLPT